jgi:hypothetical protein
MFGSFLPPPRSDIEYWRYESLAPSETLKGWKAGHPIGVPVHHNHRTSPCLDAFTHGELPCAFPHAEFPLGFHAYMPMITDDGQHVVIGIRRNQFGRACEIPVGSQIVVTRGNHKTKPVIVAWKKWPGAEVHPAANPLDPKDISAWLLRLWRIPQLTEWVKLNPEKAKGGELDTSTLVKKKYVAPVTQPTSPEELAKLKELLAARSTWVEPETSSNGSAHPPASDRPPAKPRALDVSNLGVRNPLRNGHAKRGAK